MARPIFLDLSLTEHGIVELKDNFYTGWFYTVEDGEIYSALRKKDDVPASPYVKQIRLKAYFLLDRKEAESWDERVKRNPLTVEEVDELFLSPGIDTHPFYENLSRLNLRELTDKVTATADSFWVTFKIFDRNLQDRKDRGSRQTTTRTLPLPHNPIGHFQRYGRLKERPMTKTEFETLYRRLVDPNTKLQF